MHCGPFALPYIVGMTVNVVTVAWLVFAIVFFSFPYYMPVTGMSPFFFFFWSRGMSDVGADDG